MDAFRKYNKWLTSDYYDDETKSLLREIENDCYEVEQRFSQNLKFGTGGLRALMGVGTNRLNKYTVRLITIGYCKYLLDHFGDEAKNRGIAIAYDMRHYSKEFSIEIARTCSSFGIKTYLFKEITPTPELSFTVPYLHCVGGIVITASHNPPEYNGYKIYDDTGCQVTPIVADKIINKVDFEFEREDDEIIELNCELINWIDKSVDDAFIESVKKISRNKQNFSNLIRNTKILYSPLHGTGNVPVQRVLKEAGFEKLYTVEEQVDPDPNFSTVESPNPEDESAFEKALEAGMRLDVDLILATDPDCDRVGAFVKHNNEFMRLNGNQLGSLMVYYLLSNQENINFNSYIVKTIVTSDLGEKIAASFGVKTFNTLTGFKYIGDLVNKLQSTNTFVMGYEESFGYLVGEHARDKDGVGSALIIAEMVDFFLNKNMTLIDVLNLLYSEFGFYKENLYSIAINSENGLDIIKFIMEKFRNIDKEDYEKNQISNIVDYLNFNEFFPKSDVLKIIFKDESWIAVRPSGTEPKIKFYSSAVSDNEVDVNNRVKELKNFINSYSSEKLR